MPLFGLSTLPVGLAAIMLATCAVLAVWLLIEPRLISGLAWPWRLPMILLGIWALGGGLAQPLLYGDVPAWLRLVGGLPWYPAALGVFIFLLLIRVLFI
ncbi:hypothetical protein BJB45_14185 [Halomonas huangheensis]|uniref:Uncharacterized protein n=2 Tax=Halomonas huangheensis TaxID=1178482 RepID=W1N721_9GAMM|nr:hypothetical protein AR456_13005 [Halomonas huangheensis]ERL51337.1 hypothetical protein BJB45_14185 [Halomonas huangheensis]